MTRDINRQWPGVYELPITYGLEYVYTGPVYKVSMISQDVGEPEVCVGTATSWDEAIAQLFRFIRTSPTTEYSRYADGRFKTTYQETATTQEIHLDFGDPFHYGRIETKN